MSTTLGRPVAVTARCDVAPSRWLWLVKWFLIIPHVVVLALLWVGVVVVTGIAMVAIVITGRYPRWAFDYDTGVLRWTWRVQYYAYGALATDRYPPFSLAEDPSYPAELRIAYPERLSRGLALVKWWLLAIPQYCVVAVLTGGWKWFAGGLIGILAVVAGVTVAATGRYPRPLFDLVVGLNRWVLRVAAYALLTTDVYPPFRLDMGGAEPGPGAVGGTEPGLT